MSNGDGTNGLPPIEIPWKLGGTSRISPPGGYTGSTLSIFYFEPDVPQIEQMYPGCHLVYLRFTLSMQPRLRMTERLREMGFPADLEMCQFLDRRTFAPIKQVLLDVHIKTTEGREYFVAAAPMRRQMIEDAERGIQHLDGASESLAIGKSASTLHEGFSTTTDTSGGGWGVAAPISIGSQDSTTTVSGTRDVTQKIDVTNRDASTERRDLLSHTTRISNILSLLNVYHIGSPYLRWRLAPAPVSPVPTAPDDMYSWYAELLRQRSSGLEGTQDFYAVAVVPNAGASGMDFCVDATVTEVAVFQPVWAADPKPFNLYGGDAMDLAAEAITYLRRVYPPGTSIDDLEDVDVRETAIMAFAKTGGGTGVVPFDSVRSPAVYDWWAGLDADINHSEPEGMRMGIYCGILGAMTQEFTSTNHVPTSLAHGWALYKPLVAAVLDARRDKARRDFLLGMDEDAVVVNKTHVSWCRGLAASIDLAGMFLADKPKRNAFTRATRAPSAGPARRTAAQISQARAAAAIGDDEFYAKVASMDLAALTPFTFDHPDVLQVMLAAFAGIEPGDPANRPVDVATRYGIDPATVEHLRTSGVADLRGLAIELLRDEEHEGAVEELVRRVGPPEATGRQGFQPVVATRRLTPQSASDVRVKLAGGLRQLRQR